MSLCGHSNRRVGGEVAVGDRSLVAHLSFLFVSLGIGAFSAPAADSLPSVPPGYSISVYVDGLQNPNAIAFSPGGKFGFAGELFVGDARPDAGTIYRVPSPGQVIRFTGAYDDEPRSFEFGPIGTAFEGRLFACHAFRIVTYDGMGTRQQFTETGAYDWDLLFGPGGGDFGSNLYYAVGGDAAVYKITAARFSSVFVDALPPEVNGIAFSPAGGAFGSFLYLAFARGGGAAKSPNTPAIRRVTAAGQVTPFVTSPLFQNTNQLVFDNSGNFGGMLFVSDSTANTIWQIDSLGGVTPFATGFSFDQIPAPFHINDGGDLVIGPDGALYVADGGRGAIYRIVAETADCDHNGVPDRFEVNPTTDCNHNRALDVCDLATGRSEDCNHNQIPDECEMVRTQTLLSENFLDGLVDGWSTTGLWHVSGSCSSDGDCDDSIVAYFGGDGMCSLLPGVASKGVLGAPTVSLPGDARFAALRFCSNYDGERGFAPDGYDAAWVAINGSVARDIGAYARLGEWQSLDLELTTLFGQSAAVSWHFDTVDGQGNEHRGWQIDDVQLIVEVPGTNDCNSNHVLDECEPDCNHDGIPDSCETDSDGDGFSDPCDRPGDVNHDGALDLDDYPILYLCLSVSKGPGGSVPFQECAETYDSDGDGDVDLFDVGAFVRRFGS